MKAFTLLLLVALAGCAGMQGYQSMSPEQLAALAKMKDANVNCFKGEPTVGGRFFGVFVNLDKGVIPEGGITVTPDCGISIMNTRVTTTVTTTTTPSVQPSKP